MSITVKIRHPSWAGGRPYFMALVRSSLTTKATGIAISVVGEGTTGCNLIIKVAKILIPIYSVMRSVSISDKEAAAT